MAMMVVVVVVINNDSLMMSHQRLIIEVTDSSIRIVTSMSMDVIMDFSRCRSVSISRSVSIRKWFFRPFEHIFWFKILIFGRSLPTPNFTGFRLKSTPVAQCLRAMPKHSSRNDLRSLCSFSKREKLHRQFLDGQTDQKLQSLF